MRVLDQQSFAYLNSFILFVFVRSFMLPARAAAGMSDAFFWIEKRHPFLSADAQGTQAGFRPLVAPPTGRPDSGHS